MKKYQTKHYTDFYNELEAGGIIATYDTRGIAIFAKAIAFFTSKDAEESDKISHVMQIYAVEKYDDKKIIDITEQIGSGGNRQVVYTFFQDGTTSFHNKRKKVYYAPPTEMMTQEIEKMQRIVNEAEREGIEREQYGFKTIFAFLYRKLLRFLGIQPLNVDYEQYDNICSGHIWQLLYRADFIDRSIFNENNPPSPAGLLKITTNLKLTKKPYRVEFD